MTEPWAPPPDPPATPPETSPGTPPGTSWTPPAAASYDPPRSRAGCVVAFVAMFLVGFVGVGAVLLLRAPSAPGAPEPSPLAAVLRDPPGYVPLGDATSGGGRLDEPRAATTLGRADVPGFRDGVLRAWGRRPGEPPRAVVALVVEVGSPEQATALRRGYAAHLRAGGATTFATPAALDADGIRDVPDASGRHAQRVVFTRGPRLFVVSVVTPERQADTTEVVALATAQADAVR